MDPHAAAIEQIAMVVTALQDTVRGLIDNRPYKFQNRRILSST